MKKLPQYKLILKTKSGKIVDTAPIHFNKDSCFLAIIEEKDKTHYQDQGVNVLCRLRTPIQMEKYTLTRGEKIDK